MAAIARAMSMIAAVLAVAAFAGVSAQTHHVVGGDDGWGPKLDVGSWLSGRVFRVGDKILFKMKAETGDRVVELRGAEEFRSCDLRNPIRMYTEEESHVALEEEGVRYFVSGNMESCKNGLKLPVPVLKQTQPAPDEDDQPPEPHFPPPYYTTPPPPPVVPSAAAYLNGGGAPVVILAGWLVLFVGLGM